MREEKGTKELGIEGSREHVAGCSGDDTLAG